MTDRKLASTMRELTISDAIVIYMVFCDIIGISNAAFEKERPDDFSRFLKVKKRFEDECRAQMKAGTSKKGAGHGR